MVDTAKISFSELHIAMLGINGDKAFTAEYLGIFNSDVYFATDGSGSDVKYIEK